MPGANEVPDNLLTKLSQSIPNNDVVALGTALGFKRNEAKQFAKTNVLDGEVTSEGTENMLFKWKGKTKKNEQRKKLMDALEEAELRDLLDEFFPEEDEPSPPQVNEELNTTENSTTVDNVGKKDVFISYNHGIKPAVHALFDRLEKDGFKCWIDKEGLAGGDSLNAEIVTGIRNAKIVLSCVTPAYARSGYCQKEVSLAEDTKKAIIPLLFEKPWPPEGPMALNLTGKLYIDFTKRASDTDYDNDSFNRLIYTMKKHVEPTK